MTSMIQAFSDPSLPPMKLQNVNPNSRGRFVAKKGRK
jgi:hypothetical protein